MDAFSDLDVGIVFDSPEARQRAWETRWDWEIAPWFHRFDADHVKPFFVIYLYEPNVKVDLALYEPADMPAPAGRPYRVAWDPSGELRPWADAVNATPDATPDWSNVVHEEERFWAWMFYVWQHVARGEYYHIATDFAALRDIVEQWHARLDDRAGFVDRRLEQIHGEDSTVELLRECFPSPDSASLRDACAALFDLYDRLRDRIDRTLAPVWRTSDAARQKIRACIASLAD